MSNIHKVERIIYSSPTFSIYQDFPRVLRLPPFSEVKQLLDIMSFQSYIKYSLLKNRCFSYDHIVIITPNKIKINYSI